MKTIVLSFTALASIALALVACSGDSSTTSANTELGSVSYSFSNAVSACAKGTHDCSSALMQNCQATTEQSGAASGTYSFECDSDSKNKCTVAISLPGENMSMSLTACQAYSDKSGYGYLCSSTYGGYSFSVLVYQSPAGFGLFNVTNKQFLTCL